MWERNAIASACAVKGAGLFKKQRKLVEIQETNLILTEEEGFLCAEDVE